MIPDLPPNPWTITYRAPDFSVKALIDKYSGTQITPLMVERIMEDLRCLRVWDTYDRQTDPEREQAKVVLWMLLTEAYGAMIPSGSFSISADADGSI